MLRKLMLPFAAALALSACAVPTGLCDRWVEAEDGTDILAKDVSCQAAAEAEPEVPALPDGAAGVR